MVVGVRDNIQDGDQSRDIFGLVLSGDPMYNGTSILFSVINKDVYWPIVMSVTPEIVPPVLRNDTTITGGTYVFFIYVFC